MCELDVDALVNIYFAQSLFDCLTWYVDSFFHIFYFTYLPFNGTYYDETYTDIIRL